MAIKKTVKMSSASKKVATKKSDPGKGFVSTVKDNMKKIASTKYNPKTDEKKAGYFNQEMQKAKKKFNDTPVSEGKVLYKSGQKIKSASDSTKKYTQKSLENIKNLNRKK